MKRPDNFCTSWEWAEYQKSKAINKPTYDLWSSISRIKTREFYDYLWERVKELPVGSKERSSYLRLIYGHKTKLVTF